MQKDFSISFLNKSTYKLWLVLGGVFFFLIYVLYQINAIITPFLIGFLGAYVFHVPMRKMQQWGIFRSLGALIIVLVMYFLFVLFVIWAVPFVQQELLLLIKSYPSLQAKVLNTVDPFLKSLSKISNAISPDDIKKQFLGSLGSIVNFTLNLILSLFTSGFAIANILAMLILTPFVMFYSLKDWDKLLKNINSLLPKRYAKVIRKQFFDINRKLGDYAKGQLLVCSILIISYSLFLWAIDLPYAFFIGFLTGFLAFIPYFGVALGFIISLTVGFSHYQELSELIKVIAVFGILSPIEGYFLTPRFIGQSIGLHPVLIVFSLFALGSWFGLIGIILALPLSAIITTVVRNFIGWYRNKFVYDEQVSEKTLLIEEEIV